MSKRKTLSEFIEQANKVHNRKYDYSLVEYKGMAYKVKIICPAHGIFEQSVNNHLNGFGCPSCSGKIQYTTNRLVEEARKVHGDKYDYSFVNCKNNHDPVKIICPIHGEFYQNPQNHLRGCGCKKCGNNKISFTNEEVIKKFIEVHGNKYDYSLVNYVNRRTRVKIICPIHGIFYQYPQLHLKGSICKKCSIEDRIFTNEEFIEKARQVHGDKYDYSKVEYKKSYINVNIICPEHGIFEQLPSNHLQGVGCWKCNSGTSLREVELVDYISSIIGENNIKRGIRMKIDKGYPELDCYIPELSLGIEFDGLYWHSEETHSIRKNIQNKHEKFNSIGIRIVSIFEDEWLYKQNIVKSRLKQILNKCDNNIYARNTEIRVIDKKESNQFLKNNHIQGFAYGENIIRLGLYFQNELVSVMTFCKPRYSLGQKENRKNDWELLRFCSKLNTNVIGGASKLFKYFIVNYEYNQIYSYADRRWSNGNLYEKLGFKFVGYTQPNYFYVIKDKRENRFKYRKSELVKQGYDANKSESKIMSERKINRIYDAGNLKYIYS